eukprot:g36955.t1
MTTAFRPECAALLHPAGVSRLGHKATATIMADSKQAKTVCKERAALEAKRSRPIAWCTECKAVCEEGTSFKCQDCGHYKRLRARYRQCYLPKSTSQR